MKRAWFCAAVLGAAMFATGMCLRGSPELGIPLAGVGAVLVVAALVELLLRKRRFHCPNCGAVIHTGPYIDNLAELSRTSTLKCPYCGAIIESRK